MIQNTGKGSGDSGTIMIVVVFFLIVVFGLAYLKYPKGIQMNPIYNKEDYPSGASSENSSASKETVRTQVSDNVQDTIPAVSVEQVSKSSGVNSASGQSSDVLTYARAYVEKQPVYDNDGYYETGYPTDNHGACTDVVGFALLGAGYNLMELVYQDELDNPELYGLDNAPDKCIDFRRVKNLQTYLKHTYFMHTLDIYDTAAWQGGDIVVWNEHIGIISDKRNERGIPYILHHNRANQETYEEDILEAHGDVIGHYRIS